MTTLSSNCPQLSDEEIKSALHGERDYLAIYKLAVATFSKSSDPLEAEQRAQKYIDQLKEEEASLPERLADPDMRSLLNEVACRTLNIWPPL